MRPRSAVLGVLALISAGCAGRAPVLLNHVSGGVAIPSAELHETPFFPQQDYQCGPAALATVLAGSSVAVHPDDLVDKVYLPARQGSLQAELMAASRRYGRIPYPIEPHLSALLAELAAGRPVLVLQNLGLETYPLWHYAVAVGFDLSRDEIILRSGMESRKIYPAAEFLKTWERAGRWGLVVLAPGELPASPDPERYLQAVADAEGRLSPPQLQSAYAAALQRWPDSVIARFGLGNSYYAQGKLKDAEALYRRLLRDHPGHTAARNNLAQSLADRGCREAALAEIEAALSRTDPESGLYPILVRTREEILRQDKSRSSSCLSRTY